MGVVRCVEDSCGHWVDKRDEATRQILDVKVQKSHTNVLAVCCEKRGQKCVKVPFNSLVSIPIPLRINVCMENCFQV